MALLKLANNVPGVDFIDYRDQNYYNKYQYRARVKIEHLRRSYYCTPDEFEERCTKGSFYGRIAPNVLKEIRDNKDSIMKLLEFRQAHRKDKNVTIRMEYDTMAVFHNDLQFLHDSFDGIPNVVTDYSLVETNGYVGVKTFVNEPKHKYRVYFKSKRIDSATKESIRKILETNKQLRAGPALKQWLKEKDNSSGWRSWYINYLSSNYFIDYNEESYLSYFALMHGEILGKKYKLEKRAELV